MTQTVKCLLLIAAIALVVAGCSNEPNPVGPTGSPALDMTAAYKLVTPAGDEFQSATYYVYVSQASGQTVNLHRVTADWIESGIGGVTWNNFGGSYDVSIIGSFVADAVGWRSVDVTALVEDWMDGTYDNFGILMDQGVSYPRTVYESREGGVNMPYLELCFVTDVGTECTNEVTTADAFISEFEPDRNWGDAVLLLTGRAAPTLTDKQALIRFEMPPMVELAAIGDFVWIDQNEDGIQDTGEPGMPGVTVNLYDCFGTPLASTTTDANGFYLFSDLIPGDYNVEFVKPEGYAFSPQDQGTDDASDSDADPTTGVAACTPLESGETDLTWDAGVYLVQQEGCGLTIGFWKNHAGFGPQADVVTPLLPIWLGDEGGDKSLYVETAEMAVAILRMKTYGHSSNGITKLYAQMLGTKLNIANGASDVDVADPLADADEFLAEHDWEDWSDLSSRQRRIVNLWKSMFDDYNNGIIGPGHCDD
jgi:hypothetical protein